jgi:phospholipid N-methyltransferase
MKYLHFFLEGIKHLKTVGTFTRSSKALCKSMISHIDFEQANLIVELGAGDGVITRYILEKMRPEARLLAFEVNPVFCRQLRAIDDPRLVVIEDSAVRIGHHLHALGCENADYILSALPITNLPKALARGIVEACHSNLKQNGRFIQVHYSLLLRRLYTSIFGNVGVNFVPLNLPPAFVLVSEKLSHL